MLTGWAPCGQGIPDVNALEVPSTPTALGLHAPPAPPPPPLGDVSWPKAEGYLPSCLLHLLQTGQTAAPGVGPEALGMCLPSHPGPHPRGAVGILLSSSRCLIPFHPGKTEFHECSLGVGHAILPPSGAEILWEVQDENTPCFWCSSNSLSRSEWGWRAVAEAGALEPLGLGLCDRRQKPEPAQGLLQPLAAPAAFRVCCAVLCALTHGHLYQGSRWVLGNPWTPM